MAKFEKGESGNPNGRPRKEHALIDCLIKSLDRKKRSKVKKQLLCDNLVDLALNEKEPATDRIRATTKVFEILQRNLDYQIKLDIEKRIRDLEAKIENI